MDVLMPQLGETVAEGTIAAWHKNVGDRVEADEVLLDVETDKVSMEIPSPGAGTIAQILVQKGETVAVGTVLAVVQAEGEALEAAPAARSPAAANAGNGAERAEPAGHGAAGTSTAQPGAAGTSTAQPRAAGTSTAQHGAADTSTAQARAAGRRLSPAVRRLAAEHELELAEIEGTGRDGRITRRDVIRFLECAPASGAHRRDAASASGQASAAAPAAHRAAPAAEARDASLTEISGTVPFTRIRKLTAEHMVRSKATSPHVLQAIEVDFANVDAMRRTMRESWKGRRGYSLTYLPFIAVAVCAALREFPHLNASVEGDSLVIHPGVNLGIAVDLGREGLVAPVIRGAEHLAIEDMAEAIQEVAGRARQGRLRPDDLSGGTYTLTNSGTFGTLITAPIINQPQVAILSTDGVAKKPVVIEHADGDSIAIRPVGILAQSFDHRAVDGAYSAAFLARVRKLLETTRWHVTP